MLHAYVYYKVNTDQACQQAMRTNALRLTTALKQHCKSVTIQRRVDDAATWMEIYAGVRNRESFEKEMAHELASLKMPVHRIIEWFVDI